MKKLLLLGAVCLAGAAFAQTNEPVKINGISVFQLSENGMYGVGQGLINSDGVEGVEILDLSTNEYETYTQGYLFYYSFGNLITNNGEVIGQYNEDPAILSNGTVSTIAGLTTSDEISCISADGSTLAGNYWTKDWNYLPFAYDAVSGAIVSLDVPNDFTGLKPQNIQPKAINADATVIGAMAANNAGNYYYPVIYTLKNGSWATSFPSKAMFNPGNLPMPQAPAEVNYPYPEEYMTQEESEQYYEAMDKYWEDTQTNPYPDAADYIVTNKAEYEAALADYEAYSQENEAYQEEMNKILESSIMFDGNRVPVLSANGQYLAVAAFNESAGPGPRSAAKAANESVVIYLFDLSAGTVSELYCANTAVAPHQILNDGTVIAATNQGYGVTGESYIALAGENTLVAFDSYLAGVDSESASWLKSNFTATGVVSANDDLTLFVGGVTTFTMNQYDNFVGTYSTYVINLGEDTPTAVKGIQVENGVYTVYSLQGVKVLETTDAAQLNNLKGLYIVNGKKVVLK